MSELKFPNINNCVISGRLTRDVELRFTKNGSPVAKLCIAFDRSFKKNDEWEKETSYLDVTVWMKLAERCSEYLHKGSPIIAEGYFKSGSYVDKDEKNRKTFELVAHKISFLEKGEIVTEKVPVGENVISESTKPDDDVPF